MAVLGKAWGSTVLWSAMMAGGCRWLDCKRMEKFSLNYKGIFVMYILLITSNSNLVT